MADQGGGGGITQHIRAFAGNLEIAAEKEIDLVPLIKKILKKLS